MSIRVKTLMGVVAFLLPFALLAPEAALAKAGKKKVVKKNAKSADSGKLDISDLEQKYWAPKDTDFGVVQNRTYTKEKKVGFSLGYGPLLNDGFSEGNSLSLGANYFFNERMGVQAEFSRYHFDNSTSVNAFANEISSGVVPNFGRPLTYYGLGFNWVPFYAKMSFMGKKIIYFDMMVTPGVGFTKYRQLTLNGAGDQDKTATTMALDISQVFFLEKWLAVRVDLKNRWFNEDVIDFRSPYGSLPGRKTHNMIFTVGVQVFFGDADFNKIRQSMGGKK